MTGLIALKAAEIERQRWRTEKKRRKTEDVRARTTEFHMLRVTKTLQELARHTAKGLCAHHTGYAGA